MFTDAIYETVYLSSAMKRNDFWQLAFDFKRTERHRELLVNPRMVIDVNPNYLLLIIN